MTINSPKFSSNRGFSLIELLVTITIIGIMLGIALPNLSEMIRSNAVAAQSNHFSTTINLARSEAVKRNLNVFICVRDGSACTTTGEWEDGWIVFADNNTNNTLDSGEEISLVDGLTTNYTLRASDTSLIWLAFQSDGRAQSNASVFSGLSFTLCPPESAADPTDARIITMNSVGRTSLAKGTVSDTCP
jgi:type IV fimbrial biogenesis protein FimT